MPVPRAVGKPTRVGLGWLDVDELLELPRATDGDAAGTARAVGA